MLKIEDVKALPLLIGPVKEVRPRIGRVAKRDAVVVKVSGFKCHGLGTATAMAMSGLDIAPCDIRGKDTSGRAALLPVRREAGRVAADGTVMAPTGPALGVEVGEDFIAGHSFVEGASFVDSIR